MSRAVHGQWPAGSAEPFERSDSFCRAEDLKGLLQRLSDQIADADRRHSDSMREMQARLLRLGGEAGHVKAGLPEQHAAAIERIEGGMAQLAERLAEGRRGRSQPSAEGEPPLVAADSAVAAAPLPPVAPSVEGAIRHVMPQPGERSEVPPLASAVAALAAAATAAASPAAAYAALSAPPAAPAPVVAAAAPAAPAPAAEPAAVAPTPVIEAERTADAGFRQYPDEPWDHHSAAALSRLYDSGEPGLPPRRAPDEAPAAAVVAAPLLSVGPVAGASEPPPALRSAIVSGPASISVQPAALAATAPAPIVADIEREWLEERLAEVARRVETSLADLRPDSSLAALGQRFDQFEQRFSSALDDVATRHDVEGLRLVEAHISELTAQLEQAQAQLARLDGIESQFAELRDKLSDEQILALFGGLVPTEQDLTRFAEEAAGKVADRVIAQLPAPVDPLAAVAPQVDGRAIEKLDSLSGLLSSFIDERRRGEASTADALETMQLAMQQMLDRVDALETLGRQLPAREPMQLHASAPMAPMAPIQHSPEPIVPAAASAAVASAADAMAAPAQRQPRPEAKAQLTSEIRNFAEEARAAARAAAGTAAGAGHAAVAAAAAPAVRAAQRADTELRIDPSEAAPPSAGAPAALPRPAPGSREAAEPFDRARFVALARQAAEKAQSGDPRGRAAPAAPPATSPAVAAGERPAAAAKSSMKDRLSDASAKTGVRPGMLLVASVAFLVLAGAMFVLPKLRGPAAPAAPARPAATIEVPAEAARPAGPPSRSAPAIEDESDVKPSPRGQGVEPSEPAPGGRAPADRRAAAPFAGEQQALVAGGQPVETTAGLPAAAMRTDQATLPPASLGIAVQVGKREPTIDDVMRARHRAHLASLSEQTAQNAAATSAVPEAVVPAAVREAARQTAGDGAAQPAPQIEMPPALVGPNSLRLAAQRGDASAQFEVAARFAEGKGIKQDFDQASVWYQRAAAQGFAQAQYRLATLYERGLGVKADPARARIWYQRAAEQGNLKAMHNLAVLSAGRDQGQPDYPTAAQWFLEAAERGLADSQYNLGILHESGLGVARDQIAALKWYTLAANSGDREAARRRDMLKARMDAITVKEGEDAATEWRSRPVDRMANDPRVAGEAWKQRAAR